MEQQRSEPTLHEYSRFYGIARNIAAENPQRLINHTCRTSFRSASSADQNDATSILNTQLLQDYSAIEQAVRRDNPIIEKDAFKFLSSCLRTEPHVEWNDLLSSTFEHEQAPKLELPLLTMDSEDQTMVLSRGRKVASAHDHLDTSSKTFGSNEKSFEDIFTEAGRMSRVIESERLGSSKDSFLFFQSACTGPDPRDLDKILQSEMKPRQVSPQTSPSMSLANPSSSRTMHLIL